MRLTVCAVAAGFAAGPCSSAELLVSVETPRLSVSEYHRPYVAVWLEKADQRVTNLAVWYDVNQRNNEGTRWLKDLRQWWRRPGRELQMPVDGLSGATRPPGRHQLALSAQQAPMADLPQGEYTLIVEAAREVGGRELLRLPFHWPPNSPQTQRAKGEAELDTITLELKP